MLDEARELLVVDHQLGLLAGHDVGELGTGEAGVEQERVGAELGGGAERVDEPAVVAAQDRDGA